jgi:Outer membrane protein beta-barrel domain
MNTKKLLSLVAILGVAAAVHSQGNVKFGAKAGLNVATFSGTFVSGTTVTPKVGIHAGLFAVIPVGKSKFSFVPELLVSQQGIEQELNQVSLDGSIIVSERETQDLKLTYLNVPLMFRYYIIKKLGIELGPQFGYAIGSNSKITYTNSADPSQNQNLSIKGFEDGFFVSNGVTYSYTNTMKRFDAGVNFGASFDITKKLSVQARYNLGLTEVDSRPDSASGRKFNNKNSVFQASLGYTFN